MALAAAPALAGGELRAGVPDGGRHMLITYTCDLEVDLETGEVVGEVCYARLNRYCNTKRGRCSKVAPWTRGTRTRR